MTKLYKLNKDHSIQTWSISPCYGLDKPDFNLNDGYEVVFGKLHGKLQSKFTEVKPVNIGKSNETTIEEQIQNEIQSEINKKLDEGYKYTIEEAKLGRTDANGNIKPMLAQGYEKRKNKIKWPVLVQPKYDGIRCIAILKDGNVKLLSREGKIIFTPITVIEQLKELYNKESGIQDNGIIFDGELYSDELTFQEIVSAVKALNLNSERIKYRVYDIVDSELPQHLRITRYLIYLREVFTKESIYSHLIPTPTTRIGSEEKMLEKFSEYINQGYEGLMIRLEDGKYEHYRSTNLIKYKQFDEEEFNVVGFLLGDRGTEDLIIQFEGLDGTVQKAKSMGTREYKDNLFNHGLLEAKRVTIKYFGLTDEGKHRFPVAKVIRDYE